MDARTAVAHFGRARVARLATVGADGRPHLVPITFALLDAGTILTAVDHKPKRTTKLQRLANIALRPRVAVLADHYDEDWAQLWWVRADGTARVEEEVADRVAGLDALVSRYPQYARVRPEGPLIVITVERWSGWAPADAAG